MTRDRLTLNWRGKSAPVPDIIFVDAPDDAPAVVKTLLAKAPLVVAPLVENSPIEICLGHWITWMHQDDRDMGVKNQGIINSGPDEDHDGYDDDGSLSEAAAWRMAREIGEATNAMIDSLARHHKAAIYRRCNIASVWRFPNMDFTRELPIAENELIEKLRKNIATRAFW